MSASVHRQDTPRAAMNGHPVQPPRPLHVLIVEDQADAGDSLALVLRMYGFDVAVARDGAEAYTAARAQPPDVLLMDIGLPRLNGWEVARQLRELCPVRPLTIAVTGYGLPADRQRSRDEGFDFHLLKPVEPLELAAVLREHGRRVAGRA
jgi:DNA-binding response OmpR family regulator